MNNPLLRSVAAILAIFAFATPKALGDELKTQYATIQTADHKLINKFNDSLYLGRELSLHARQQPAFTVDDEVGNKLNVIVEKIEAVLDMYPPIMHFTIILLPSKKDVQETYFRKYGKRVDHIAYYSLGEKTIYLSTDDVNLRVLAHEVGHMVVDHYFKIRPPSKIHELLAQYAESHITD